MPCPAEIIGKQDAAATAAAATAQALANLQTLQQQQLQAQQELAQAYSDKVDAIKVSTWLICYIGGCVLGHQLLPCVAVNPNFSLVSQMHHYCAVLHK